MRGRDPCLTLRGFWTSAQAPVQATPGLACERRFLARGAAAGSGATALEGARGTKAPRDNFFKVVVCHTEISASYEVPLYPTLGVVPRDGRLGPRATVRAN
ncbi:hypothetical protein N9I33_00940 [Paracoccaceae bacterium]|nr:hypothetical protein [Paracoccaceae bacterium]